MGVMSLLRGQTYDLCGICYIILLRAVLTLKRGDTMSDTYCLINLFLLEEKTFKNVKYVFRVALKSTEARRKSQPCPLRIGWALAKSYGDLFYIPKLLPCCQKKILLIALLSEESFANSLAVRRKFC